MTPPCGFPGVHTHAAYEKQMRGNVFFSCYGLESGEIKDHTICVAWFVMNGSTGKYFCLVARGQSE